MEQQHKVSDVCGGGGEVGWGVGVFDADLMKGFTSVSSALMYQAGWTTNRPLRSFLSLSGGGVRESEEVTSDP